MDSGVSSGAHLGNDGLRERQQQHQQQKTDAAVASDVLTATGEVDVKGKHGEPTKTFGRTPEGVGKSSHHSVICLPY